MQSGGLVPPLLFMDDQPLQPTSDQDVRVQERKERTMRISILGIDLGKHSCSVIGLDAARLVVMRRDDMIAFASKLASCTMAMEACCVHPIS